jgi:hypothetical protein
VPLSITTLIDQLTSGAGALGVFDTVNAHEPKSAPGSGVSCSLWFSKLEPIGLASGLASASCLIEFQFRIYTSMLQEPQDGIDPLVLFASDQLFAALVGGFSLGGNVRQVDVFGAYGEGLRAQAGYLTQDNKLFRVIDIHCPLVINDVYTETA